MEELDAFAREIGFTDAMMAAALERARPLAAAAGRLEALALAAAPAPPAVEPLEQDQGTAVELRRPRSRGGESESTDVDRDPGEGEPAPPPAASQPDEQLDVEGEPATEDGTEAPRRGRFMSSVKKLFGK